MSVKAKRKQTAVTKPTEKLITAKQKPVWFKYMDGNLIGLILLGILVTIIRMNFLEMPFERDEGAYAYYGQMILDGRTPYLDFYETKPPGLFYSYAFLMFVFGNTVSALHIAGIILNLATIGIMYFIGKKLMNGQAGLFSATSFAFLSLVESISGFTVQGEHVVVFFMVAGVAFYVQSIKSKRNLLFLFLAGSSMAMSAMIKQNGVFYTLFLGLVILVSDLLAKPFSFKKIFKELASYAAGIVAVVGLFLLIILAKGAFQGFWKWIYTMPKAYTSLVTPDEGVKAFKQRMSDFYNSIPIIMALAGLGILSAVFIIRSVRVKLLVPGWIVFSFLSIIPGLWFYNHYFILLTPAMALGVGAFFFGAEQLSQQFMKPFTLKAVYLTIFIFIVMQQVGANKDYYFAPDHTKILREVYGFINPFPEAYEIGSVLKERTTEKDTIGVLGGEPEIFIYTGRRGPSAHNMAILLYGGSGIKTRDWQIPYIADVERVKPKYFVCFNNPISLMTWKTDTFLFNWFNKYMVEHYNIEGIVDPIDMNTTRYLWDKNTENYVAKSQQPIFIFRRKEDK